MIVLQSEADRLASAQWRRDHGELCEALTRKGAKCPMLRKFGQVCGVHYKMLEADINSVTVIRDDHGMTEDHLSMGSNCGCEYTHAG